jgi:hypothetical protein
MREGTFEEGYRDGWESVTDEPVPDEPTCPPECDSQDFEAGFRYGKSEALMRFEPHA